jgi:hypothetical protein
MGTQRSADRGSPITSWVASGPRIAEDPTHKDEPAVVPPLITHPSIGHRRSFHRG